MSIFARRLTVENYRNFASFELELDEHLTMLVGRNAVGKTNLVEAFSAAFKRVAVIAKPDIPVRFTIDADAGTLTLTVISADQGRASETIDIEVEGEGGTIAFKNSFIHDCLSALGHQEKEITLELKSYQAPGVFKSYDKINYLYLVMPVRI